MTLYYIIDIQVWSTGGVRLTGETQVHGEKPFQMLFCLPPLAIMEHWSERLPTKETQISTQCKLAIIQSQATQKNKTLYLC